MHRQTMTKDDEPRPCEWCENIIPRLNHYTQKPTHYYIARGLCFCSETCAQMQADYGRRDNPEFQAEITTLMAALEFDAAVYEHRREQTHGVRYPRAPVVGNPPRKVYW